jgi:hypothetical protein
MMLIPTMKSYTYHSCGVVVVRFVSVSVYGFVCLSCYCTSLTVGSVYCCMKIYAQVFWTLIRIWSHTHEFNYIKCLLLDLI